MLDSEAVPRNRAKEIGLSDAICARLDNVGWNTYGKLAFASNFQPGQADETPRIKLAEEVAEARPPTPSVLPLIRRLVCEWYPSPRLI